MADAGTSVVVGAANGIGTAIALELARVPGTRRIVIADIDVDGLARTGEALATAEPEVVPVSVDIADAASVAALLEASSEASRVAITAGVFAAASSLEVSREEFERLMAVNLTGVFFVAQGYARHMVERGEGAIVAVASVASRHPRMRQAGYCASKAGMRQALRVLALETVPRGVRINFVSPGPTDTEMMRALARDHASVDDLASGSAEAYRPPILDGRVARPADIAAAVRFLLGPESGHVALHDLVVDGGELLGV